MDPTTLPVAAFEVSARPELDLFLIHLHSVEERITGGARTFALTHDQAIALRDRLTEAIGRWQDTPANDGATSRQSAGSAGN